MIRELSPEARSELMALMWYGREPLEADYMDHLVDAREKQGDPGEVIYIAEKSPALPGYLRKGLERLNNDGWNRDPPRKGSFHSL